MNGDPAARDDLAAAVEAERYGDAAAREAEAWPALWHVAAERRAELARAAKAAETARRRRRKAEDGGP